MEELPKDLLKFVRSYKPTVAQATEQGIEKVAQLADIFCMEPTGVYHKVWQEGLARRGKQVLIATGIRIRNHARERGIMDKSDRTDAAIIASYAYTNLDDQKAFIDLGRSEVREAYLLMRSIPRIRRSLVNRIRCRLSYESAPLATERAIQRAWGNDRPPAIWRRLAEEEGVRDRWTTKPSAECGRGISPETRKLAQFVCELERFECELERNFEEMAKGEEFSRYDGVFESWQIPAKTKATLLATIHPIEQFLDANGRRIVDRQWNEAGTKRNKRDRSLKHFQRVLGCGKVRVQSGDSEKLIPTGDKEARTAMIMFLQMMVVIRRTPNAPRLHKILGKPEGWDSWDKKRRSQWVADRCFREYMEPKLKAMPGKNYRPWNDEEVIAEAMQYNAMPRNFARLQLFYEFAPQCQNLKRMQRLLKTYPLFCRWLFADLVKLAQPK